MCICDPKGRHGLHAHILSNFATDRKRCACMHEAYVYVLILIYWVVCAVRTWHRGGRRFIYSAGRIWLNTYEYVALIGVCAIFTHANTNIQCDSFVLFIGQHIIYYIRCAIVRWTHSVKSYWQWQTAYISTNISVRAPRGIELLYCASEHFLYNQSFHASSDGLVQAYNEYIKPLACHYGEANEYIRILKCLCVNTHSNKPLFLVLLDCIHSNNHKNSSIRSKSVTFPRIVCSSQIAAPFTRKTSSTSVYWVVKCLMPGDLCQPLFRAIALACLSERARTSDKRARYVIADAQAIALRTGPHPVCAASNYRRTSGACSTRSKDIILYNHFYI